MAGKVVKQLAGSGTGQSLSDMMTSMKHTLSGSLVAKVICKATTEEMISPKRKHLDCMFLLHTDVHVVFDADLVQCTFEPRLSVPDFANCLVGRTQHNNLVVVFKAFITIHHLMQYGHERFSQYIASNNCHFYSSGLSDKNAFQAHGITAFIRPYAKYLDAKAISYQEVAFDLCRLKSGKEDGSMRTMSQAKLFKTVPIIEKQLDSLLAFDATSNELVNTVLRVVHLHLYRDLIRLYAVYNEAMINLIDRYFKMSKRDCKTSLTIYKSFIKRMESMNAFVKVAESSDTSGIPSSPDPDGIAFKPVPTSILEALEQHLVYLEGHKPTENSGAIVAVPAGSTNTSPGSVTRESGSSEEFHPSGGMVRGSGKDFASNSLSVSERQYLIDEERARLESFVTIARKQASDASRAEAVAQPLQQLSADPEFIDLLTEPGLPGDGEPWPVDAFTGPEVFTAWPIVSSSVPAPNQSRPSLGSNNPFLTQPSATNGGVAPPSAWGAAADPFGVAGGQKNDVVADVARKQSAPVNPLDARLNQLAGTLSIGDAAFGGGGTADVSWRVSAAASMRNSSSLSQLTGPTVTPASGVTNPWYQPSYQQPTPIAATYVTPATAFYPSSAYNHNASSLFPQSAPSSRPSFALGAPLSGPPPPMTSTISPWAIPEARDQKLFNSSQPTAAARCTNPFL